MSGGIPTKQTIERVMSLIDSKELENILTSFFLDITSFNSNNYGICLASEMIDDKTNEIPIIKEILKRFSVKDIIITWDALNTQKENVKEVMSKNGDYVVSN